MPPVRIRPFAPADQRVARALILAGLCEHWGWLDPNLNPDLDDIAASYLAPGHVFFVAQSGQALTGTGAVIVDGNVGQIVRVAVHPQWRRRGIARALIAVLLEAARARDLDRDGWRRMTIGTTPSASTSAAASRNSIDAKVAFSWPLTWLETQTSRVRSKDCESENNAQHPASVHLLGWLLESSHHA